MKQNNYNKGLCTQYLNSLPPEEREAYLKKSLAFESSRRDSQTPNKGRSIELLGWVLLAIIAINLLPLVL